jgi:hypothetical protein
MSAEEWFALEWYEKATYLWGLRKEGKIGDPNDTSSSDQPQQGPPERPRHEIRPRVIALPTAQPFWADPGWAEQA